MTSSTPNRAPKDISYDTSNNSRSSTSSHIPALIAAILAPVALGSTVGFVVAKRSRQDYEQTKRPSWSPPSWAFGPVWTTLYALMGLASWFVWKELKHINEQLSEVVTFVLSWCADRNVNLDDCPVESPDIDAAWRARTRTRSDKATFRAYVKDLSTRLALCKAALILYVVQLFVNLIWSPVYFGGHRRVALVIIALLDLLVIATVVLFAMVRPVAAWLLVPYLLWLGLATALSVWIIRNNNPAARTTTEAPADTYTDDGTSERKSNRSTKSSKTAKLRMIKNNSMTVAKDAPPTNNISKTFKKIVESVKSRGQSKTKNKTA